MKMTLRWFGPTDPIPLAYIRQIPGVTGVVSDVAFAENDFQKQLGFWFERMPGR